MSTAQLECVEISFDEFRDKCRAAVLDAFDDVAQEIMGTKKVFGATDADLPELFLGLDTHIAKLATRLNGGREVNSAHVHIGAKS